MTESKPYPKACIFDIGGVVVGSPLVGINKYEKQHNLPFNYLNVAITQTGKQGAFQRLERSEIDMYTFYKQFGEELSKPKEMNEYFKGYCKLRGIDFEKIKSTLPTSLKVDGRELFGIMMKESTRIDPLMEKALKKLKESKKFKLAALTNNFSPPTKPADGGNEKIPSLEEELKHLGFHKDSEKIKSFFDFYIESAKVGMRKPEIGFYNYALNLIKSKPEEVVFLDDIGHNLKAAQSLGIQTIRVFPSSSLPAIRQLEKIVKIQLISDQDAKQEEQRIAESERRKESKL